MECNCTLCTTGIWGSAKVQVPIGYLHFCTTSLPLLFAVLSIGFYPGSTLGWGTFVEGTNLYHFREALYGRDILHWITCSG